MRIAMIGRDLPRSKTSSGVAGQIHLLAEALSRSGNEVTVYAMNRPSAEATYRYQPIPFPERLRRYRRAALYLIPWGVSRIPLDTFDVIHAHGEDQLIRSSRPLVRTFHGHERAEARSSRNLRRRLYHLSMVPFEWISERRATVVVAVSRSTQRYLGRQAVLIPNGYDPAVFHPGGPKSPHASILFVGDFGTRKRAELLLQAFTMEVRAAIQDAELWMVTTDSVSAPGVHSLGRVLTQDLAELYRKAWVFCMPSSYEGFGVPYVEAMASGTPVIATANGGAEDVLDGGRAGTIVSDRDVGKELVRLLSDDPARRALTASGLERAKEYDISQIADQYVRLYHEVADLSSPAAPS